MNGVRLEVLVRVGPENDRVGCVATGGSMGYATIAHGLYAPLDLATAVCAALVAALGEAEVALNYDPATGAYTYDSSYATDAELRPGLATILGSASTHTNVTNVVGSQSPCVWLGRYPGRWTRLAWKRSRKVADFAHGRRQAITLARWRTWGLELTLDSSELTTLRTCLSYALRGLPFRVYSPATTSTAWSWASWSGTRTVRLDDRAGAAEDWLTSPHQTVARLTLDCVEYPS